jgi:hypothetical protein
LRGGYKITPVWRTMALGRGELRLAIEVEHMDNAG